jgi:uncharacterized protein (UPF0218 family)
MPWSKTAIAAERSGGKKLLSAAYRDYLGALVTEELRQQLRLPEGSTWSDAIAFQTVKRAVGIVPKENICFTAITELREATEGKIAEKLVATGNEELAALAAALSAPPHDEPE